MCVNLTEDNNNDSLLSVKTPWGLLAKSQGIESELKSLREELSLFNKRIRELEKGKPSLPPLDLPGGSKPAHSAGLQELKASLLSLEKRITTLESNQSTHSNQSVEAFLRSLNSKVETSSKRLDAIEKALSQIPTAKSTDESTTKTLLAFDKRIVMVENRMSDLEAKFEKFSSKTLQILEQLRKI